MITTLWYIPSLDILALRHLEILTGSVFYDLQDNTAGWELLGQEFVYIGDL